MKKQYREKEVYQKGLFWSVSFTWGLQIHLKFAEWNRLSWTVFFRCQTCKHCLWVATYLWPALFFSTSLLVCMIGTASSGRDRSTITSLCSSCWGAVENPPLCLLKLWVDGAIKSAGWKLASVSAVFLGNFSSPKDASFQGFLICKLFPQLISLQ